MNSETCSICGGVNTCPENEYTDVLLPEESDMKWVPAKNWKLKNPLPEGWTVTHEKRHEFLIVRTEKNGIPLQFCGTAQSRRIQDHFDILPKWCGQCTYAFYAKPMQDEIFELAESSASPLTFNPFAEVLS